MTNRFFAAYCLLMVSLLAYANHQGYVFSNIFDGQSHAGQSANRYHK